MSAYENYNMELLMGLKSEIEELGHLPKDKALLLIQTCASLILQNEDVYKLNLEWQCEGEIKYEKRVYQ